MRRAVPLALALTSTSNPQLPILELLNKYSHDADISTHRNAVYALGLIGAGTNNARLAAMLRQLASYHHRDVVPFFLICLCCCLGEFNARSIVSRIDASWQRSTHVKPISFGPPIDVPSRNSRDFSHVLFLFGL